MAYWTVVQLQTSRTAPAAGRRRRRAADREGAEIARADAQREQIVLVGIPRAR